MHQFEKRLSLLEENSKALESGGVWVDMLDNKVRVDINSKHGKEIEFPTVFQAGQYVQKWKEKAVSVCGVVFVSFFPDLMYDKPSIPVSDELLKHTAVILNLSKWENGTLEDIALASWARMHPEQVEAP